MRTSVGSWLFGSRPCCAFATCGIAAAASTVPKICLRLNERDMVAPSHRLRCGPEEDLVDIDVVRLADRERDAPSECTGSDGDFADELPGA